jgi:hypothetical protein
MRGKRVQWLAQLKTARRGFNRFEMCGAIREMTLGFISKARSFDSWFMPAAFATNRNSTYRRSISGNWANFRSHNFNRYCCSVCYLPSLNQWVLCKYCMGRNMVILWIHATLNKFFLTQILSEICQKVYLDLLPPSSNPGHGGGRFLRNYTTSRTRRL